MMEGEMRRWEAGERGLVQPEKQYAFACLGLIA